MGTYSYTGKAQFVTIDVKGTYDITADGAAGGGTSSGATEPSGKGAEIGGDFKLAKGEKLEIFAGGSGAYGLRAGGAAAAASCSATPGTATLFCWRPAAARCVDHLSIFAAW